MAYKRSSIGRLTAVLLGTAIVLSLIAAICASMAVGYAVAAWCGWATMALLMIVCILIDVFVLRALARVGDDDS